MDKYKLAMTILEDINNHINPTHLYNEDKDKTNKKGISINELALGKISKYNNYKKEEKEVENKEEYSFKSEILNNNILEINDYEDKKIVITYKDIKFKYKDMKIILITKHTIVTSLALEEAKKQNIQINIK